MSTQGLDRPTPAATVTQSGGGGGGIRELRLALVCYGGVSLAIYMHGITKEIEKLVAASAALASGDPRPTSQNANDTTPLWWDLLADRQRSNGVQLQVVVDIIAGTSA